MTLQKYIRGPSKLEYYQELWAFSDTQIFDSDDRDTKLAKLAQRLEKLRAFQRGMEEPWFKALETILMDRVLQIDCEFAWQAWLDGKDSEHRKLGIQRTGIVALFAQLHAVDVQIKQTVTQMEELGSRQDAEGHTEDMLHD